MPYRLEQSGAGYYVVGPSGRHSKQPLPRRRAVQQMRALYAAEKDAGTAAGASLAGPGGLLGTPGLGRRWGNRTKDRRCTCGVVTKAEQLAPGITRIRGNLCNVHGRYGRCPGSSRAPKGQPKATPEQRANDRAAVRQDARDQVLHELGIDAGAAEALAMLRTGEQPQPAALARMGAIDAGLVEQAEDGSYRMTPSGRALMAAAESGDVGRAGDVISAARDRKAARTAKERAAAQKKLDAASKRAEAAAAKQPAKGGGGGKQGGGTGEAAAVRRQQREQERQDDRKRREDERQADRAKRQAEHDADRAQRLRERAEDRQARLDERRARQQPSPVAARRVPIVMPQRRRNAARSKSFTVYKDAAGTPRWLARSTTAYRDRDREILEIAALDADSQRMTAAKQFGPLRWWHVGQPNALDATAPWGPGLDIGDCDFSMQIGTTRVESGTFKDAALAETIAATADEYELSPGFFHPYGPHGPPDGIYQQIRTFERSLVPTRYGRASNLFTGLTVKEFHMDPNEMERRFKAAIAQLRLSPEQAEALASGLVTADKSAQAQGVAFKSDDAPQVYTAPDGTPGLIVDGRFVALKASMAPASMEAAADTEMGDAMEEQADAGDAAADDVGGEYIGDMTPAEFWAQLQQYLAPVLKMQEMHKAIGDMVGELKGMGAVYATKDAQRLATLEAALAQLEGHKPAVVQTPDVESALKSAGPQSPPDPSQPQLPPDATPLQQYAARTMPALYANDPSGQFHGWAPPTPLPPQS